MADCDFVKYLVRKYLDRVANKAELQYHAQRITQGKTTHALLEEEFATCAERQQLLVLNQKKDAKLDAQPTSQRLAVMVCGHFRDFAKVKPLWVEFVRTHPNVDIFIHTWQDQGKRSDDTWIDPNQQLPTDFVKDVTETLKPLALVVEDLEAYLSFMSLAKPNRRLCYTTFPPKTIMARHHFSSFIVGQLYSIYRCWYEVHKREIAVGHRYSTVIRMRADASPYAPDITSFAFDPTALYVQGETHKHPGGGGACGSCNREYPDRKHAEHTNDICDIYYYGSSKVMQRVCEIFHCVDHMVEDFQKHNAVHAPPGTMQYMKCVDLHVVRNHNAYENSVKCFYPERLIREHMRDTWILTDPCKAHPIIYR
jgi:hypothetical protein